MIINQIGGWFDEPDDAITDWNRRSYQPDEPLTLDELRGMDGGKYVWLIDRDKHINIKFKEVFTMNELFKDILEMHFGNFDELPSPVFPEDKEVLEKE